MPKKQVIIVLYIIQYVPDKDLFSSKIRLATSFGNGIWHSQSTRPLQDRQKIYLGMTEAAYIKKATCKSRNHIGVLQGCFKRLTRCVCASPSVTDWDWINVRSTDRRGSDPFMTGFPGGGKIENLEVEFVGHAIAKPRNFSAKQFWIDTYLLVLTTNSMTVWLVAVPLYLTATVRALAVPYTRQLDVRTSHRGILLELCAGATPLDESRWSDSQLHPRTS